MTVPDVSRRTVPREADREAWLSQRAPYVGASECAALFDEHPFLELGDLAAQKIDGTREEQNAAMTRGVMLEDAVAQWWATEHGRAVSEVPDLYLAGTPTRPEGVVCVTLDRAIDGELAALEVKTTARRVTEPERYWYWQCQAQLLATGYERVELAVLDGSMQLLSFTVLPHDADQAELLRRAERFLDAVERGELPAGAGVSKEGLRRLYPDPEPGSTVELVPVVNEYGRTPDPLLVLRDLKLAKARLKHDEHTVAKLEGVLRAQLRNAEQGTIDGRLVVTLKTVRRRDIDGERLRTERPEVAEEYSKETSYRRMLLK